MNQTFTADLHLVPHLQLIVAIAYCLIEHDYICEDGEVDLLR